MGRRNKAKLKAHGNGLHSPYLRHENNKKQAEHNTLLVFVLEIMGSRLPASAHGKAVFIYNLFCASVQPDAGRARSGLHSPYFRHLPNAKEKDPNESNLLADGGDKGSRTPDLLNAIQALYQLSYTPEVPS